MGGGGNAEKPAGRPVLPALATGPDMFNVQKGPGVFPHVDGRGSVPGSAISSVYSDREGGQPMAGERESDVNGLLPDLEKLSLEKGRPLDAEDLDDEGWLAASEQKMIVELGGLGEGAGGAVTRCRLKEGKTVFALKVILLSGSDRLYAYDTDYIFLI